MFDLLDNLFDALDKFLDDLDDTLEEITVDVSDEDTKRKWRKGGLWCGNGCNGNDGSSSGIFCS